MKKTIILVRHAKAMERDDFRGKDDSLRPLVSEGEKKFLKTLNKAKKNKLKIRHAYHSPFLRCKQTAKLLNTVYDLKSKPLKALAHGGLVESLYSYIVKAKKHTAFIGHEPELSELCLLLDLTTQPFKKGELRFIEVKIKNKKVSFKLKHSSHST